MGHLDNLAGPTMSLFLENYVRGPIDRLIEEAPKMLPELGVTMSDSNIQIRIGEETLRISRRLVDIEEDSHDEAPDDIQNNIPG